MIQWVAYKGATITKQATCEKAKLTGQHRSNCELSVTWTFPPQTISKRCLSWSISQNLSMSHVCGNLVLQHFITKYVNVIFATPHCHKCRIYSMSQIIDRVQCKQQIIILKVKINVNVQFCLWGLHAEKFAKVFPIIIQEHIQTSTFISIRYKVKTGNILEKKKL